MVAGIPGTGLGGIFYILLALLMPLQALAGRWHRTPGRWRIVFRQLLHAVGILMFLELSARGLQWSLREVLGPDAPSTYSNVRVAALWGLSAALATLGIVVIAVNILAFVVARARRREDALALQARCLTE